MHLLCLVFQELKEKDSCKLFPNGNHTACCVCSPSTIMHFTCYRGFLLFKTVQKDCEIYANIAEKIRHLRML